MSENETAAVVKHLEQVATAMWVEYGPEHERHQMWAAMSALVSMAADHAAGRGDACGSCVDQTIKVADAYTAALTAAAATTQPAGDERKAGK